MNFYRQYYAEYSINFTQEFQFYIGGLKNKQEIDNVIKVGWNVVYGGTV